MPGAFLEHTGGLAVRTSADLRENIIGVVRMFSLEGDYDLLHNLPGRPMYDPALSLLFLTGIVVVFAAAIQPLRRRLSLPGTWEIPAILSLAWFTVMLLPTLLSEGAPDFLRSQGLAPVLALIGGFGVEGLRRLIIGWRPLVAVSLSVILVFGSVATTRDYFGEYARHLGSPVASIRTCSP
jgi:hypothetical protein